MKICTTSYLRCATKGKEDQAKVGLNLIYYRVGAVHDHALAAKIVSKICAAAFAAENARRGGNSFRLLLAFRWLRHLGTRLERRGNGMPPAVPPINRQYCRGVPSDAVAAVFVIAGGSQCRRSQQWHADSAVILFDRARCLPVQRGISRKQRA